MRKAAAGSLFLFVLLLTVSPVSAATVTILGSGILFEAGNNETNTVVLNGSLVDDPELGDGFLITDSTANNVLTSGEGCRASGTRAVCGINPTFVKLELRDRDDTVTSVAFVRMIVNGGTGNDTITGGNLDDDLDGDLGDDTIDGRDGDDLLRGGLGNDHLFGRAGKDRLIGSTGEDTLDGGLENDELDGGLGGDTLIGGAGLDQFEAGAGKDRIEAQDGIAETIRCGGGKDTVIRDSNDKTKRCN
jgi:Ca2+-binding RTX toxin-like protein